MNCPLCIDQVLEITHRGGIEIDVCPRCRGVWLDRGELEKLAAVAAVKQVGPSEAADQPAGGKKKTKKSKKKTLAERLGDALEEVLDL